MSKLLLIIDMQNGFVQNNDLYPSKKDVISNILNLKKKFKDKEYKVIYTTIIHKKDGSTLGIDTKKPWNVDGTYDSKIITELLPDSSDTIINKYRFSSFFKTNLSEFIKENKITEVYISGAILSLCVLNTSLDCYNYDISSKVIIDAVLDFSEKNYSFFSKHFKDLGLSIKSKELISLNSF